MKDKKQLRYIGFLMLLVVPVLLLTFCSKNAKLLKELPEIDQEFISTVRYLITSAEKKKFFTLTNETERKQFRLDFWKKRDPDPATEENEFQQQYFERIEEANRLFSIGHYKGWLTDRGHVLVILGPPETKRVYPSGYQVEDYPSEVWFYGYFPVVFVDRNRTGDYDLVTLNLWHMAEIVKAQKNEIPSVAHENTPFGFKSKIFMDKKAGHHNLQLALPYRNIIFQKGKEGFNADIIIRVEIIETKKNITQSMNKNHSIMVTESELKKLSNNYILSIPLKLEAGKYEVTVIIESKADNIKVKDKISFKI